MTDEKDSKKFLLLTLEYPPFKGGVAHYYGHMIRHWPEGEVKVIDNSQNKLVDDKRNFLKWWPAIKTLSASLRAGEAEYVLIGHLLPLGTVAWLLSFVFKFKYCVFLHGYDLSLGWAQEHKRWLIKAVLNRADKIIAANSYTQKHAQEIINYTARHKVFLVNPGIEAETIAYNETEIEALKKHYNLSQKTVLLTVTRLVERKGVDMALEGLKLALREVFDLFYVIIGYGQDEARLRQKIANLGLSQNVLILTDDSDKLSWYKLADIFIMTARQIGADVEGFGIVYLEAGLAGKPVIAGACGGVADAVADNVNGLMVDGAKPEQIAEAIIKLAKYEKLRQRLGDEGRRRALTMFNWQGQAEKIFKILN